MSDGMIAKARAGRVLFLPGIPCRTVNTLTAPAERVVSWPVSQECRDGRRTAAHGVTLTWPPGAGETVWLVAHDDGTVGAYLPEEVEDDG